MLDTNTKKPASKSASKPASGKPRRGGRAGRRRGPRTSRRHLPFSRLTATIFLTQLFGLSVLMVGSLRISQYRDGLIDAKLEGVRAQAQVIASIMATVAAEDAACDILAEGVETAPCQVELDTERVNTIFTRVWPSFEGRVRVYETPASYDGAPITDAREILLQDKVLREGTIETSELPDIGTEEDERLLQGSAALWQEQFVDLVLDRSLRADARAITIEDELTRAFLSAPGERNPGAASLRYNEDGELVASVSVPIRKVQAIYGVVTAEIGGIEAVVGAARRAQMAFFVVAILVSVLLTILFTLNIATPIRSLARAADRVRDGIRGQGKMRMPAFPRRRDEIGELSESLRDLTIALHDRIEAIDNFAADVSHELKNPLTSIRSATETLDLAVTEDARERLLKIIASDVARMDRLITDISNASRIDAELAREGREVVDVVALLKDVVGAYNAHTKEGRPALELQPAGPSFRPLVFGSPSALGQVFRNLIDNAISFSPPNGTVYISFDETRPGRRHMFSVRFEDDGPGIPPDNLESIFKRFYTRRPEGAKFGNNSGLGLAICRQITESHDGTIWAENRDGPDGKVLGARFVVSLPGAGGA